MSSSQSLPVDTTPGTVHLVDLTHSMHTRHADGVASEIILVPTPSTDPDDPLNWSPGRKRMAIVTVCVYVDPLVLDC